jgi:hypothetical protein
MSARDDLLSIVHTWLIKCAQWDEETAPATARAQVDAYAHELAEKIREHCRSTADPCGCPGADLIDPEVEA